MVDKRDRELIGLVDDVVAGELDRRDFVRRMGALGAGAIFGGPLAAAIAARGASAAPSGANRGAARRYQDPPPAPGGTVVAATIDKPVNMDPAYAELYSSMQVYQNIFSKLVYVDANYNFIPGLAKSWTQVDPQTWEFELVENAVFHNDEPFTSRDVAFSVERIFEPKLEVPDTGTLTFDPAVSAPNAVFLQVIQAVETDGDYKVRFKLRSPWGSFLNDLAAVLEIVNEKGIASGDPRLNPIGTGPFRMTEWVQDDHITLEKWSKYHYTGLPYLDKVIFRAIADDTVRETGLKTDEMQWVMQVPLQKVEELKGEEDIKVTVGKPYLPDFVYLNGSKPPFNDKRVRQALAWCIDRQQIVDVAFFGQAVTATEPVYDGNPYYSGLNAWADGPDYDKAKALLAEAGAEGLKFLFAGQPQVPTQIKSAQVLQQQLKNAGIEMEIQNYESGEWFNQLFSKSYEATISYWSATLDPVHFLYPGLLSTSGWNISGYASPEMDAALKAFAEEPDVEKRKEAYKTLIALYQEEAPIVPIDNQLQQYWVRANVYGMTPLPTMEIRMEPVYIAQT